MTEFLSPYMPVISLIVLAIVVAIGFIKKVNLGFLSLGVAFVLAMVGGLSAKDVTSGFSSSMFVTLVGVIDKLGGITMVSEFLQSFMGEKTAVPILAATSGILSWVSSTTGVVMPALYPVGLFSLQRQRMGREKMQAEGR